MITTHEFIFFFSGSSELNATMTVASAISTGLNFFVQKDDKIIKEKEEVFLFCESCETIEISG